MKNFFMIMKKIFMILLGVVSFVADIITLTPFLKKVLVNNYGLDFEIAVIVNNITFIVATFILLVLFSLLYKFVKSKCEEAGTHKIACALIPYARFIILNKTNLLLRLLHCDLYHTFFNAKNTVLNHKRQRNQNPQNAPLSINDIKPQIHELLDGFYRVLYEVFRLDLSINFYLSERNNGNTVLKRCLFIQNRKEQNRGEMRRMDWRYIIHDNEVQSIESYATNARTFISLHPNTPYKKNSIFDYVLTTDNPSWMSNDLTIDEQKQEFYTSSNYYNNRYKSLAVFAIIPPNNANNPNNAIKGLLTFDSCKTRKFSEKECTMLMGLMAHLLYELLDSLN